MVDSLKGIGSMGGEEGRQFVRLLMANQDRIYGYILTLVADWSDADDIMQETAEVMWGKYEASKPICDFASWGIRIAQNKIFNFYARKSKSEILLTGEILENIAERAWIAADGTDGRIKALEHCLAKLNERDRKLVRIKYEQNITVRKLAEIVERPVQGMYKVMARIHGALLECIQRTLAREGIS
jgi:RNA polymerase sigma-70 factor (ECF subfamily)